MKKISRIVHYLSENNLVLATAESCTAGEVITTLAREGNCGDCLFISYIVYHEGAKIKQLGVSNKTIKKYTLTSEEVAKEMAYGAFQYEEINLTIATTGIMGKESMNGVPQGTVCFAWGFKNQHDNIKLYSETKHFNGSAAKRIVKASNYALTQILKYHPLFLNESL